MTALAGVELESLVSEPDALTTRPPPCVGKSLLSPNDPLDVNEITGIIYQIPCYVCTFVYTGQTKRDLKSQLLEHKRAIKYQRNEKSALCEHSITLDH